MDKPKLYKIEKIEQKTPKVKSFCFYSEKISREAKPGQFLMVWVPGFDEFPISIASAYNRRIEIAVAKVGKGTEALHKFKVGDYVGIKVFEEIKNGLKNYMEKNGYKNINELISFP
jgi:dihydroorotate dehydrogenase electron transfer subunit